MARKKSDLVDGYCVHCALAMGKDDDRECGQCDGDLCEYRKSSKKRPRGQII